MAQGSLFSPEAVLMLFIAVLLDLFGLVCLFLNFFFFIGEFLSLLPDGIGLAVFGSWFLLKAQLGGESKESATAKPKEIAGKIKKKRITIKKVVKKTRKVLRGKWGKFGLSFLGEMIPFLGALPFWTLMVYSELRNQ